MPKKFQNHFQNFIEKHSLLNNGKNIVVSFSGGIDSVVLVDLLISCGYSKNLLIIHYNHLNRRGNAKDEEFVRSFCKERDLDFQIIRLEGLPQSNFESTARDRRYKSLKSIAKGYPLLFGHHIDDSFEWSLMQQFKSSSLRNSIGIPLVNENIVRPLMCFSKIQILYYAKLRDLEFSQDPTNASLNYERNYVRNIIVPAIKKKYPSYLKNYVSRANQLALKFNLSSLKQKEFTCFEGTDYSELYSFDHTGEYDRLDELINTQVKRLSSKKRGSTRLQIEKVKKALKNNSLGPLSLVDGIKVYVSYNHLYISKRMPWSSSSKNYSKVGIEDFICLLLDRKTFFCNFCKVKNYKLNTINRSYPFDVNTKGKIAPLDLLRQWNKPQNKNKLLDLVF